MSEKTTTLSISLDEDAVYKDCVEFNRHVDEGQMMSMLGNQEEALTHAIEAINVMAGLLNSLLPDEVWVRFGERALAEQTTND